MGKKETKASKPKKTQQNNAPIRLLWFVLASGSVASVIVLTMVVSESSIDTALNVVAGLNGASAVYFVLKLLFD